MAEDTNSQVMTWLSTQGYRFELIVARAFRKVGFEVEIADYYEDPETNKTREIDVVARTKVTIEGQDELEMVFVIECKHSREKPWVVFKTIDAKHRSHAALKSRCASDVALDSLLAIGTHVGFEKVALLALPPVLGYGVTQALSSGKDIVYDALNQVAGAAEALKRRAVQVGGGQQRPRFVFPAICIQGQLFECTINNALEMELQEVDQTAFHRRGKCEALVDIVTDRVLEYYAQRKFDECLALGLAIQGDLKRAMVAALEKERRTPRGIMF